jgi:predicted TIM-barrel fold metal-dependent hydrolase
MPRYLEKFPGLRFIVDHCGMPIEANVSFRDAPTPGQEHTGPDVGYFDEVLKLGGYPNVALKWSHAQGMFGMRAYPSIGLRPFLRRALDAFGPERVMWASDYGGNQTGETWGELLHYIRDNPDLSDTEKAWLMGGTVRAILDWPRPA